MPVFGTLIILKGLEFDPPPGRVFSARDGVPVTTVLSDSMGPEPTKRLKFRQIKPADADFIFELYSTASFKRFIADKNFQAAEDARRFIESSLATMYQVRGMGLQLVELKSDSSPVGICGLIKRESLAEIDLGFGYLPAHEGLGYGLEAAQAFIQYASRELKLARIVALTTSDNSRCISLLEKLNFRYGGVHEMPAGDATLGLYLLEIQ